MFIPEHGSSVFAKIVYKIFGDILVTVICIDC